jgi:hypothetical protein
VNICEPTLQNGQKKGYEPLMSVEDINFLTEIVLSRFRLQTKRFVCKRNAHNMYCRVSLQVRCFVYSRSKTGW